MTQVHSSHPRPFSTIADDFVTRYASRHQRPKTLTETRRYIDQHLKPAWGDMDIRDIDKPQVFAVLDAMMDRGTEVSANRCLATVRRLFNWCVERGYLERSPTAGIRPARTGVPAQPRTQQGGACRGLAGREHPGVSGGHLGAGHDRHGRAAGARRGHHAPQ
jgi:integrase